MTSKKRSRSELRVRVFDGRAFILSATLNSKKEAEHQNHLLEERLGANHVRLTHSWRGYALWQAWERP